MIRLSDIPPRFWATIQDKVHQHGFNACLYGSVLTKGESMNDIDILLVPWRPVHAGEADLAAEDVACTFNYGQRMPWKPDMDVGHPYLGAMDTRSYLYRIRGVRIDIQVRMR